VLAETYLSVVERRLLRLGLAVWKTLSTEVDRASRTRALRQRGLEPVVVVATGDGGEQLWPVLRASDGVRHRVPTTG
jgi:hypothetical protein